MVADSSGYKYYISHSELAAWKRCRRKWYLAWYRKLTPRLTTFSSAAQSGTRVHEALSYWYVAPTEPRIDPLHAHAQIVDTEQKELLSNLIAAGVDEIVYVSQFQEFEKVVSVERSMLEGYMQWLTETGADEEFDVISSETPLVVPLVDMRVLTIPIMLFGIGILDVRVRRKSNGDIAFLDHKTVASLTQALPTLRQNEQMLHYMLLEAISDGQGLQGDMKDVIPAGAYYNMLRRVKRTGSAKPPFFDRKFISHTLHEVRSHAAHVVGASRDIIETGIRLKNGMDDMHQIVYPSVRQECSWDCPFFSVCSLFDDGSHAEAMLEARYTKHDPLDRYTKAFTREDAS